MQIKKQLQSRQSKLGGSNTYIHTYILKIANYSTEYISKPNLTTKDISVSRPCF